MRPPRSRALRVAGAATSLITAAALAAACGAQPTPGTVRTLAKVEDWRQDTVTPGSYDPVFELAYDADTAQAMWDASIPTGLPPQGGEPTQDGVYGDLSEVDFTTQAVALWSSGQSTCPGWLAAVETSPEGQVKFTENEYLPDGANGCGELYSPYRTFVVMNRADVPEQAHVDSAEGALAHGSGDQTAVIKIFSQN